MRRLLVLTTVVLVMLITVPVSAAMEIIMTQRNAVYSGTWTLENSATNKFGTEYRHCVVTSSGTQYALFTPNIPITASDWQVYAWFPTIANQTAQVRYTVTRAGGSNDVNKSQTTGQGTWVLIGAYAMNAGTANSVKVTTIGSSGGRVAVDAIRFYSATASDTTAPTISAITPLPGSSSVAINWTTNEYSTSQVEYGPTASYGQQTALDRTRVMSHQVMMTGLNRNAAYHFRVKSTDAAGNTTTSSDQTFATLAANTPELRGAWLYTWGDSMLSASQITDAVNTLYAANYNVVIPEIRKAGDAYYNSAYEPRAGNIIDPLPFDPLQDMITKAHAKGMEVQGWFVTYRIWSTEGTFGTAPPTHIWSQHPEYAMKTSAGSIADGIHYNLDPGVPAVQDYICKVIIDMITKYDLDGINWDYVRYPGTAWGYNDITEQRYFDEYGYMPPTSSSDPNWGAWCDYRRQQVTDLVKKTYLEVMWRKPQIKMCVDTVGWEGSDPNTDYTHTSQYSSVFQNAKSWMEQHIIDSNRLMNYKREYDSYQASDFRPWNRFLKTMQDTTGRFSICGPGVYLNYTADSMTQLAQARSEGLKGLCTYAYHATNVGGDSSATFYNTIRAQMFPDPAPIPEMPWKTNPTTGFVFGNVTDAAHPNDAIYQDWVYKASVTLTGPYPSAATQTTLTDATGTYGFIDVAPGQYTVSFSKTGFSPITGITASVTAGLAKRLNVLLAAPLAPGSYKTLSQANDPALMNVTIGLNGNVVTTPTGSFADCSYIEATDRSSGLQVCFDGEAPALSEGDSVNLIGKITTIGDQRALINATLQGRSSGTALRPLGSTARDLNRFPQTTGLLVTGFGNVTYKGTDYFYIDDGSAVNDGSGHLGVKVLATGLSIPSTGYAKVTGISTCEKIGGLLYQRIRVRKQADMTVY